MSACQGMVWGRVTHGGGSWHVVDRRRAFQDDKYGQGSDHNGLWTSNSSSLPPQRIWALRCSELESDSATKLKSSIWRDRTSAVMILQQPWTCSVSASRSAFWEKGASLPGGNLGSWAPARQRFSTRSSVRIDCSRNTAPCRKLHDVFTTIVSASGESLICFACQKLRNSCLRLRLAAFAKSSPNRTSAQRPGQ